MLFKQGEGPEFCCLWHSLLGKQLHLMGKAGGKKIYEGLLRERDRSRFALPPSAPGKTELFPTCSGCNTGYHPTVCLQQPGQKLRHGDAKEPCMKGASSPLHPALNPLSSCVGRDGGI